MNFPGKNRKEQIIEDILLEKYNSYYRLAYSYVHSEADAADIVQNGAYKAILHSDTLRKEEYAATWIYRIMLNEIFRFLQKDKFVSLDAIADEREEARNRELMMGLSTEDAYEDVDLRQALNEMDKEDKAVIELKYFEDMKLTEIAEVLGENVNTVKSRLYRGLKKLRVALEDS